MINSEPLNCRWTWFAFFQAAQFLMVHLECQLILSRNSNRLTELIMNCNNLVQKLIPFIQERFQVGAVSLHHWILQNGVEQASRLKWIANINEESCIYVMNKIFCVKLWMLYKSFSNSYSPSEDSIIIQVSWIKATNLQLSRAQTWTLVTFKKCCFVAHATTETPCD